MTKLEKECKELCERIRGLDPEGNLRSVFSSCPFLAEKLLTKMEELLLQNQKSRNALDQVLNEGDGTYKP